jgi:Colicin V production protein.
MSIFLDLLVFAVIFLSAFIAYRRGFVLTLLRSIGYFVSFLLALFLSNLIAPLVWKGFVRGIVISEVTTKLPDISGSGGVERLMGNLPESLNMFNINQSEFFALFDKSIPTRENVATVITDNFISPAAINIIGIIVTVIFVIIFFIIVMILSKKLKFFNRIPLVGTANRVAGGLLGVIAGLIWLCVIALIIHIMISLFPQTFEFTNAEVINKTIIFGPFYNLSRAISGL